MKFEVRTKFAKEDIGEFQRVSLQTIQKKKMMLIKIIYSVLAILFLFGSVWVAVERQDFRWFVGGVVAAAILFFAGYYQSRPSPGRAWRKWKRATSNMEMLYQFDEENFIERMGANSYYKNKYTDIYACFENKLNFFVFVSKEEGYMIKKSDFVLGKAKDFKAFIEKQCNGRIKVYAVSDPVVKVKN
ncbi:MAG: YcxB family protein [Oscillospiraceae bacterium]|nr:YcxB family protein [Oscillospiraceae bacterium]